MNAHPLETYSAEEREAMLRGMRAASNQFYAAATGIGNHPFIEFCGLMNEYIKICQRAHDDGLDFTICSAHSGHALPMATYEAEYLGEKLGCVYGPALANPALLTPFLTHLGVKLLGVKLPHRAEASDGGGR